ncbi:MAG: hypothetical protein ACTSWM_09950, partial [Alphaproteobacteria bacterium]
ESQPIPKFKRPPQPTDSSDSQSLRTDTYAPSLTNNNTKPTVPRRATESSALLVENAAYFGSADQIAQIGRELQIAIILNPESGGKDANVTITLLDVTPFKRFQSVISLKAGKQTIVRFRLPFSNSPREVKVRVESSSYEITTASKIISAATEKSIIKISLNKTRWPISIRRVFHSYEY